MDYRRLGRSGLRVSEFSYGSWVTFAKQVDVQPAKEMLTAAYDAGINFFDNAEGYEQGRSELVMGQAIQELGWSRDSYIVSSKVFWGGSKPTQKGLSAKHVTEACHAALKRLRPVMEQPQYNLFERQKVEADYAPVYESFGLGTTIWSPLASGLLTGKYNEGIPQGSRMNLAGYEWLKEGLAKPEGQARLEKVRALSELAGRVGLPLHHMALLWCLANPHVSTVILGASRVSQLTDNIRALDSKALLTADVLAEIETIMDNKPTAAQRF